MLECVKVKWVCTDRRDDFAPVCFDRRKAITCNENTSRKCHDDGNRRHELGEEFATMLKKEKNTVEASTTPARNSLMAEAEESSFLLPDRHTENFQCSLSALANPLQRHRRPKRKVN